MTEVVTADGEAEALSGGLPQSERQNQFSLAFVHMIATAAGCSIKDHKTDYDGVDITIASSAQYRIWHAPQIELQLKCTTQQRLLSDESISWQMDAGPFEKLTRRRFVPAYLGILLVPEDPDLLLEHDEAKLLTRSRLFWQSAGQLGTVKDGAGSKTVHLPRSNLFTAEQLLDIMKVIGEGGDQ